MPEFDSYSSYIHYLSSSKHGYLWNSREGLIGLSESRTSEYTITYIAQALNKENVDSALTQLSSLVFINSVSLHPYSREISCDGLCIGVSLDDGADLQVVKRMLDEVAQQLSIDLCITKDTPSLSVPGLLVMDMDSTMIQIECIDEIARLVGRYAEVAKVTEQAMRGELDFAASLQTRVACLKGVEEEALRKIKRGLPLMPGLINMVNVLKRHEWRLAIASGGFTYFADYLMQWLDLDAAVSNQLVIKNGVLTGQTSGAIVDAQVKADTLDLLTKRFSVTPTQTVAMGDGANDVKMLNAAQLGVAFHAKPSVQPLADAAVNLHALDALILLLKP